MHSKSSKIHDDAIAFIFCDDKIYASLHDFPEFNDEEDHPESNDGEDGIHSEDSQSNDVEDGSSACTAEDDNSQSNDGEDGLSACKAEEDHSPIAIDRPGERLCKQTIPEDSIANRMFSPGPAEMPARLESSLCWGFLSTSYTYCAIQRHAKSIYEAACKIFESSLSTVPETSPDLIGDAEMGKASHKIEEDSVDADTEEGDSCLDPTEASQDSSTPVTFRTRLAEVMFLQSGGPQGYNLLAVSATSVTVDVENLQEVIDIFLSLMRSGLLQEDFVTVFDISDMSLPWMYQLPSLIGSLQESTSDLVAFRDHQQSFAVIRGDSFIFNTIIDTLVAVSRAETVPLFASDFSDAERLLRERFGDQ
jgi:hypothetical protein